MNNHKKVTIPDSQFICWARPIYISKANRILRLNYFLSFIFLLLNSLVFSVLTGTPLLGTGSWLNRALIILIATISVAWASRPLLQSSILLPQVCEPETPQPIQKTTAFYNFVSDTPKRLLSSLITGFAIFTLFNPSAISLKTSWVQDEGYPRLSSGLFDLSSFLVFLSITYSFRRLLNNPDLISFKTRKAFSDEKYMIFASVKKGCHNLHISALSVLLSMILSRFFAVFAFKLFVKTWLTFQDALLAPSLFRFELWPRFPIQIFTLGLLLNTLWGSLGSLVSIVLTEPIPIQDALKAGPKAIVTGLSNSQAHDDYIRMLCVHVLKSSVNDFTFRSKIYGSSGLDSQSASKGAWPAVREALLKSIEETKYSLNGSVMDTPKSKTKTNVKTENRALWSKVKDMTCVKNAVSFLRQFAFERFQAGFALLTPDHPQVLLQSKTNEHQIGFKCALVMCHLLIQAPVEDEVGIIQFEVAKIFKTLISLHTSSLNLLARIDLLGDKIPALWGRQQIECASKALKEQIELISRIYDVEFG